MTDDTPIYSIHIIDQDRLTLAVLCGDLADEAQALNWAYYYLGRYRCDAVRLFRRCDTYGNATDLVTEIEPPAWIAERDQGPYGLMRGRGLSRRSMRSISPASASAGRSPR